MISYRSQISLSAELNSLPLFRRLVEDACLQQADIDDQTCYDLKLAVDEACTNIIEYGYACMDPGSIILEIEIGPQAARIKITDFGCPFEPVEIEAADADISTENGMENLGLFFIHQSCDLLDYQTSEAGNTLVLVKYLTG